MYGISPEDRLWMVKRDQAERRQLSSADRMAATRDGSREQRTQAGRSGSSLVRGPVAAVSHVVHALTHVHPRAQAHGTAR